MESIFDHHSLMKGRNQGKLSWGNNHIFSHWLHAPTWSQALHPWRLSKKVKFQTTQQRTQCTEAQSICKQNTNKMRMHTHTCHISLYRYKLQLVVLSRYTYVRNSDSDWQWLWLSSSIESTHGQCKSMQDDDGNARKWQLSGGSPSRKQHRIESCHAALEYDSLVIAWWHEHLITTNTKHGSKFMFCAILWTCRDHVHVQFHCENIIQFLGVFDPRGLKLCSICSTSKRKNNKTFDTKTWFVYCILNEFELQAVATGFRTLNSDSSDRWGTTVQIGSMTMKSVPAVDLELWQLVQVVPKNLKLSQRPAHVRQSNDSTGHHDVASHWPDLATGECRRLRNPTITKVHAANCGSYMFIWYSYESWSTWNVKALGANPWEQ